MSVSLSKVRVWDFSSLISLNSHTKPKLYSISCVQFALKGEGQWLLAIAKWNEHGTWKEHGSGIWNNESNSQKDKPSQLLVVAAVAGCLLRNQRFKWDKLEIQNDKIRQNFRPWWDFISIRFSFYSQQLALGRATAVAVAGSVPSFLHNNFHFLSILEKIDSFVLAWTIIIINYFWALYLYEK